MRCQCGYKIRTSIEKHEAGEHHKHGNKGREKRFERIQYWHGRKTNVEIERTITRMR